MYNLSDYRKNYSGKPIKPFSDPFKLFEKWFEEAKLSEPFEVNAMILSTVDAEHRPHTRVVLLKSFSHEGFIFFTNYLSAKGKQIENNPHVSLLFFWQSLQRQVRISGIAQKIPKEQSDEYFYSRPSDSQRAAVVSKQSQILTSRTKLIKEYKKVLDPVRPEHWGGYIVTPNYFEFWQGMESRLHDRVAYTIQNNKWTYVRLYP